MNYLFSDFNTAADAQIDVSAEMLSHGNALRLQSGELVGVLNGRGLRATCRVERLGKTQFELYVMHLDTQDAQPALTLIMGTLDSRDRLEFAVEKAIEIGVGRIILVSTTNSQPRRVSLERLKQKARAAITQCGAFWMPEFIELGTVSECLNLVAADAVIGVGDANGMLPGNDAVSVVMVGPEGGFSEEEQRVIDADSRTIKWRIGNNRLRTETAAVAMLTAAVLHLSNSK